MRIGAAPDAVLFDDALPCLRALAARGRPRRRIRGQVGRAIGEVAGETEMVMNEFGDLRRVDGARSPRSTLRDETAS